MPTHWDHGIRSRAAQTSARNFLPIHGETPNQVMGFDYLPDQLTAILAVRPCHRLELNHMMVHIGQIDALLGKKSDADPRY